MSRQDVEVVREHLVPHEGEDVLPVIKGLLDRFGPDAEPDAILATLADDPGWRLTAADVEWDMSATAMGGVAHGVRELAVWWGVWVAVWSTQVYRMREYRDMGDAVLTVGDVHATARGYSVDPEIFQVWRVRDGKIVLMRAFLSEEDALNAVGE
jgi:ketosteroid isomerase-like protein